MTFRLTKHHGLGNDFLVHLTDDPGAFDDRAAWAGRAVRWCHRRHGVGADGLLIGLHGSGRADLVMTTWTEAPSLTRSRTSSADL